MSTKETKEQLVATLNRLQKWGHGLSRKDALELVQLCMKTRNLKIKLKNNQSGEQCFFCIFVNELSYLSRRIGI